MLAQSMKNLVIISLSIFVIVILLVYGVIVVDRYLVDREMIRSSDVVKIVKDKRAFIGFIKSRYFNDYSQRYIFGGITSDESGCITEYGDGFNKGVRTTVKISGSKDEWTNTQMIIGWIKD